MAKRRQVKRMEYDTLLLVGEGESELAFLQHVKTLYVARGSGLKVTIICAHGKGAAHVVDVAIRKSANTAFNTVAALLDTDTDWSPAVMQRADKHGVHILRSEPMFEALMLRMHGIQMEGRSSDELKRRFQDLIQNTGLHSDHYGTHFGPAVLQQTTEETIRQLLQFLGVNLA